MPSSVISHECARSRIVGAIALGAVARIALHHGIGAALHRAERRRCYCARGVYRATDNSRGCIKRRKAIVPVSVITPIASSLILITLAVISGSAISRPHRAVLRQDRRSNRGRKKGRGG